MALFKWEVMDVNGFVMLGSNASRMLDLLGLRTGKFEVDMAENEVDMAIRMADMFELSIAEMIGKRGVEYEMYGFFKGTSWCRE